LTKIRELSSSCQTRGVYVSEEVAGDIDIHLGDIDLDSDWKNNYDLSEVLTKDSFNF